MEGGRACTPGPEVAVLLFIFCGAKPSAAWIFQIGWQHHPCGINVLDDAVFMFLLVTMETIRIDGFHGDYLKISFFDSPDVAAASLDALSAIRRLLCGNANGCYERSWIQTKLPPAPENARTPSWEPCTSAFSWGPTHLASAPQPIPIAWKLFIIIIIIIVKQNKKSLYCGNFQANTKVERIA